MNGSYANPPVIEVFCEFQFVLSQPADITTLGLFYDKIKDSFPVKTSQIGIGIATKQTQVDAETRPLEGGLGLGVSTRARFFRPDRSALVQATPDTLTVNHLTPYSSWDEFEPIILSNFKIFRQIINPKAFKRVTLGYINRLDFSELPAELKDCFNLYLVLPERMAKTRVAFTGGVEIPCEGGRNSLSVTLQSIPPTKPDAFSFILNLNYHTTTLESAGNIHLDSISEWMQAAHDTIIEAFEQCLTAECKARFEGIK